MQLNIQDFKKLKFEDYYYNNSKFMNIIEEDELLRIVWKKKFTQCSLRSIGGLNLALVNKTYE